MVIGSMAGAGVFSLPARFAQETGVAGALVAWTIAGTGMLMLAFVFQTLAIRKPELDAGVYAYARAGFGEYPGFFSAFGYWASACVAIYEFHPDLAGATVWWGDPERGWGEATFEGGDIVSPSPSGQETGRSSSRSRTVPPPTAAITPKTTLQRSSVSGLSL